MNKPLQSTKQALESLRSLKTIRKQALRIFELAKHDSLQHFALDVSKLPTVASFVIEVMQAQYPDFNIPYHSRWRHFEAGSVDRIHNLIQNNPQLSTDEKARMLIELVIISVFLDAGAGPDWVYQDAKTSQDYSRSEGLALASLALYENGSLSMNANQPLRIDAEKLLAFDEQTLCHCFQVNSSNPLEGVTGRVNLLKQLGSLINKHFNYFGIQGRLGDFFDYLKSIAKNNHLSAESLFDTVLEAFNSVWPARLLFNGEPLGDVWAHSSLKNDQLGVEYVPFHKLSQWLTYSLIEPLEQAGIKITDLDALTGLPEYRNGGLFIDLGVLQVKDQRLLSEPQDPSSEAIIEWRALTVILLDELALLIRKQVHQDATTLPLAKILQGGTWEAGRRIARSKRPLGVPPIQIISDGTVF